MAQHRQLVFARWIGDREVGIDLQWKPGVVLYLVRTDAGVERQELHLVRALVEAEEAEIGDHPEHAAGSQPRLAPAVAAGQEAGAGDEVDPAHKPAPLVL